jgi:hypothetical protein
MVCHADRTVQREALCNKLRKIRTEAPPKKEKASLSARLLTLRSKPDHGLYTLYWLAKVYRAVPSVE